MKKFIKKIFIFILTFFTLFNNKNNVESTHIHVDQIRNVSDNDDSFNFSNLIVFARFKDDDEFVDNSSLDGFLTLVDDTFNNSSYSISSYINSISNNHIRMKYLYLFNNGGSIQLDKNRGYYSSYSENNTEGYKSDIQKDQRMEELRMDWSNQINDLLLKGEKITNLNSTKEYSYLDLDRYAFQNKYLRIIDNITIIFKKDNDTTVDVNWGDPLSTYHDTTNRVYLDLTDGGHLESSNYVQVFLDYDYMYSLDDNSTTLNTNVIAHETCHAIGLYDLYSGTTQNSPCGYMSILGKKIGPIGQFITAKERDYLHFLSSTNLIEIKEDGNYTINLTKDSYQDEVIAYKIVLPSKKELYFEYRNFNSIYNRFDNLKKIVNGKEMMNIEMNSGLIISRVNYPNNALNNLSVKNNDWVYEVLGDSSLTKTKAALNNKNAKLTTDDIDIEYISNDETKLTFSVKNMPKANVTSIEFKTKTESIKLGESFKYEVLLNGENTYYSNVTYSLEKNTSINTKVDDFGNVTIASDENADQIDLIVKAGDIRNVFTINIDKSCTHEMYYYSRVEATCFNEGNIEYYKCNKCNKYFSDFEGKNEINPSSITLEKLKHVLSDFIVDKQPTLTSTGHRYKKCLRCNTILVEEEIPKRSPSSSNSSSNTSNTLSSTVGSSNSSQNNSNSSHGNQISYEKDNNISIILMSVFIPFGSICLISLIYFIIKKKLKK